MDVLLVTGTADVLLIIEIEGLTGVFDGMIMYGVTDSKKCLK